MSDDMDCHRTMSRDILELDDVEVVYDVQLLKSGKGENGDICSKEYSWASLMCPQSEGYCYSVHRLGGGAANEMGLEMRYGLPV